MMAYVLEYQWGPIKAGWPINHDGHEAVETDFQFKSSDARFPSKGLTSEAVRGMKAYLDLNDLRPRLFSVLPCCREQTAYFVLRFETGQVDAAALTKLFCS
jgi:hypothetical protein